MQANISSQDQSKFWFPYVVGNTGKFYRLLREISSGSFGKVYEAWEIDENIPNKVGGVRSDNDNIIIKIIKTNPQQQQNLQDYEQELRIMRDISDNSLKGFPKCLDWGQVDSSCAKYFAPQCQAKFIVQNRLGKTLSDIFLESRRRLRKADVLKIGIQLLKSIQRLHSIGYLHLDIKPDNILIEPNKADNAADYIRSRDQLKSFEQVEQACRQSRSIQIQPQHQPRENWQSCDIFLIDFGVSRLYLEEDRKTHIKNVEVHSFVGNIIFASHYAFQCQTLSRRDDIIQIIYNLVYLMNPEVSWVYDILNSDNIQEEMKNFKIKATAEEICHGERCQCLIPICKDAYSYGYEDEPQYGKLIFMLEMELIKMYCVPDNIFTFMQSDNSFVGRAIAYELIIPDSQEPLDNECDFGELEENNDINEEKLKKSKLVQNNELFKGATIKNKEQIKKSLKQMQEEQGKVDKLIENKVILLKNSVSEEFKEEEVKLISRPKIINRGGVPLKISKSQIDQSNNEANKGSTYLQDMEKKSYNQRGSNISPNQRAAQEAYKNKNFIFKYQENEPKK